MKSALKTMENKSEMMEDMIKGEQNIRKEEIKKITLEQLWNKRSAEIETESSKKKRSRWNRGAETEKTKLKRSIQDLMLKGKEY